jgi:mRNA interferase MazF
MTIHQGGIYWIPLPDPVPSGSGIVHPHVVIQDDIINNSRIQTVVVCGLTTNMKRVDYPGNILLEAGEANLPKQSIVAVSQISTVAKADIGAYIGTLSAERVAQIFAGMKFLQTFTEPR